MASYTDGMQSPTSKPHSSDDVRSIKETTPSTATKNARTHASLNSRAHLELCRWCRVHADIEQDV